MQWIILFIVSWILFFLLVDYKELKTNIWCGVLAVGMQLSIDTHSIKHGSYEIINPAVSIWGSSLCFVLGPVLVVATLLAQYFPGSKWLRIISVFVFSALYSIQELLLLLSGALSYLDWHFVDSLVVNTIVMATLGWFSIVVLDKKGVAIK
ncbi:MAG: hypothetical protein ACOYWZ_22220 [Bacillota bacterium]